MVVEAAAALAGGNRKNPDGLLDPSGSGFVMSHEHYQIHQSNGWDFSRTELGVILNGEVMVQIKSATKILHLKELRIYGDSASARFELLEAPTFTTGTTAIVMPNRRRSGGAPAPTGVTAFSDPTGVSIGTGVELKNRLFGGGAGVGQTAFAGTDQTDREWELAVGITYIIRVTNLEANARGFSIDGFFYLDPTS